MITNKAKPNQNTFTSEIDPHITHVAISRLVPAFTGGFAKRPSIGRYVVGSMLVGHFQISMSIREGVVVIHAPVAFADPTATQLIIPNWELRRTLIHKAFLLGLDPRSYCLGQGVLFQFFLPVHE